MQRLLWVEFGLMFYQFMIPATSQRSNEQNLTMDFSLYDNFTCGGRWSCDFDPKEPDASPSTYLKAKNCACDALCAYFGDCCEDSVFYKTSVPEEIQKVARDDVKCKINYYLNKHAPVYQVARCPQGYEDQQIVDLCQYENESDILLMTPVSGKRTQLLYQNFYCALCHEEEYTFWVPTMVCKAFEEKDLNQSLSFKEAMADPDCNLVIGSPDNFTYFHPCNPTYDPNPSCPPPFNNTFLEDKCRTDDGASKLVFSRSWAFKNKYCALCHLEKPTCKARFFISGPPDFRPYSLSILFNIKTGALSTSDSKGTPSGAHPNSAETCEEDEVYDVFIESCRRLVCRPPFIVESGICVVPIGNSGKTVMADNQTSCTRVELEQNEFEVFENHTLLELSSGRMFDEDEFELTNSSAFVCLNSSHLKNIDMSDYFIIPIEYSNVQLIFSFVCLVLSMVFLALTIVVYGLLPSLRNVPGLCIISLSLSLFIAKFLLLTASSAQSNNIACIIVAVFMHFFFLVAFCWMNVLSFNIFLTFSKDFTSVSSSQSTMRFIKYSLYAWLAPLVPVLSGVIVDNVQPGSEVKPNYGKGICWFGSQLGLVVFFMTPLAVLIVSNIVCFVISARAIFIAKRHSARMLGSDDKGAFFVYLKLFVIMGLTWILGFLTAVVSHPSVWYVYITVNSLQGLFIFLSFVVNKRVLRMLKVKVCRSGPQRYGIDSSHSIQTQTSEQTTSI